MDRGRNSLSMYDIRKLFVYASWFQILVPVTLDFLKSFIRRIERRSINSIKPNVYYTKIQTTSTYKVFAVNVNIDWDINICGLFKNNIRTSDYKALGVR
jgi:hypothetical protein